MAVMKLINYLRPDDLVVVALLIIVVQLRSVGCDCDDYDDDKHWYCKPWPECQWSWLEAHNREPRPDVLVIQGGKIIKALKEYSSSPSSNSGGGGGGGGGYKIMSVILERNLPYLLSNHGFYHGLYHDLKKGTTDYYDSGNLTLYRERSHLLIFVPKDDGFLRQPETSPPPPGKTRDFGPLFFFNRSPINSIESLLEVGSRMSDLGFQLHNCSPKGGSNSLDFLLSKDDMSLSSSSICVDEARIVDWEIYKDRNVAVHGVDGLFLRQHNSSSPTRLPECHSYL